MDEEGGRPPTLNEQTFEDDVFLSLFFFYPTGGVAGGAAALFGIAAAPDASFPSFPFPFLPQVGLWMMLEMDGSPPPSRSTTARRT